MRLLNQSGLLFINTKLLMCGFLAQMLCSSFPGVKSCTEAKSAAIIEFKKQPNTLCWTLKLKYHWLYSIEIFYRLFELAGLKLESLFLRSCDWQNLIWQRSDCSIWARLLFLGSLQVILVKLGSMNVLGAPAPQNVRLEDCVLHSGDN